MVSSNNPVCCKSTNSPQTDIQGPLLKTPSRFTEHREVEPVPTERSLIQKGTLNITKRNVNTDLAINPLIYSVFCLQYILGQWWHDACWSNQRDSDLTQDQLYDLEPVPISWVIENKMLASPKTEGKTKYYNNKAKPFLTFSYAHQKMILRRE